MRIEQHSLKNTNEQIDQKGLLQPESNNHTLYVMPPGATPEEQHALENLSRAWTSPTYEVIPSGPEAR